MSNYMGILNHIRTDVCQVCRGHGFKTKKLDSGVEIKFTSIICEPCKGTGWQDGKERKLIVRGK